MWPIIYKSARETRLFGRALHGEHDQAARAPNMPCKVSRTTNHASRGLRCPPAAGLTFQLSATSSISMFRSAEDYVHRIGPHRTWRGREGRRPSPWFSRRGCEICRRHQPSLIDREIRMALTSGTPFNLPTPGWNEQARFVVAVGESKSPARRSGVAKSWYATTKAGNQLKLQSQWPSSQAC